MEFYPSITSELLQTALDFAPGYDNITAKEREIILHAKKSILFNDGNNWGKKTSNDLFDITMGSYDGAESCELVGAYILHQLNNRYKNMFGLYRDDGLGITDRKPHEVEAIKKDICSIFNQNGLRITIQANKKIVNFLDVTLDLHNGEHRIYNKPNNIPQYVNSKSNHPPVILKNIPVSINKRLSEISCNNNNYYPY